MSDSRNNPPDDFDKTRPNIKLPDQSDESSDWNKTNYNYPKQPAPDEWGKTITNIKPIDTGAQDFPKTMYPGSSSRQSPEVNWGETRPNINLDDVDFGGSSSDGEYGKTTPYFQLPEAERQKYQQLPPTPTEQAAAEEQAQKEAGGIPGWVWVSVGLLCMFFFSILVLVVAYMLSSGSTGFNVTVRSTPPGSTIRIDNTQWNVSRPDGSVELVNLSPGRKVITVEHDSYECVPLNVEGGNGIQPKDLIAQCTEIKRPPPIDCTNIKPGEEDRAEQCYNAALDALPDPFTVEDLVKALNILIINFDSGKHDVPPKRLVALKKGAGFIQKLPAEVVLEIGGHTDNVGRDESNQVLSDNRAKAVKEILMQYGVRGEILQTRGYGAGKPKTTNETEFGKFQNRRIEYSVVKQ